MFFSPKYIYIYNKNKQDCRRRHLYAIFEKQKFLAKYLMYHVHVKNLVKFLISKFFFKIKRNASITRIVNRCIITGRSKFIISKYKISRHTFKRFANAGILLGFKRAGW